MKKIVTVLVTLLFITLNVVNGQSLPPSTKWFEDARFGLFIHYGLYSVPGGEWEGKNYYGISEWLMRRARIPVSRYEQIAKEFNPRKYNAESWVRFAKSCGFKYIVITAKHHDGFAMYHSKVSKYNIVDATPFKRDLIAELAKACKKYGMKLGFYYSQTQDWHEKDAVGNDWDFTGQKRNFQKYLDEKCKPQLEELLTNYGEVSILWFDTPQDITKEASQSLVDWVHKFQPNCLTSSRVGNGLGDYIALRDHEIPRSVINRPFEALFTHNGSWGYSKLDKNFRSPKEILRLLLASSSKGGNLIMNIGPRPDGTFQKESIEDFTVVGEWLRKNGEAVYGSGASPLTDMPWGYITTKPGILYLHVLDWPCAGSSLRIPVHKAAVTGVTLLSSGERVPYEIDAGNLKPMLPDKAPDELCTVIKITYTGTLPVTDALPIEEGYNSVMYPKWATLKGKAAINEDRWMEAFGDWHYATFIDGWKTNRDVATWKLDLDKPGKFKVVLDYQFSFKDKPAEGVIRINGNDAIKFQAIPTGDDIRNFSEQRIGMIEIKHAGEVLLTISPSGVQDDESFIKLRKVKLIPYELSE